MVYNTEHFMKKSKLYDDEPFRPVSKAANGQGASLPSFGASEDNVANDPEIDNLVGVLTSHEKEIAQLKLDMARNARSAASKNKSADSKLKIREALSVVDKMIILENERIDAAKAKAAKKSGLRRQGTSLATVSTTEIQSNTNVNDHPTPIQVTSPPTIESAKRVLTTSPAVPEMRLAELAVSKPITSAPTINYQRKKSSSHIIIPKETLHLAANRILDF